MYSLYTYRGSELIEGLTLKRALHMAVTYLRRGSTVVYIINEETGDEVRLRVDLNNSINVGHTIHGDEAPELQMSTEECLAVFRMDNTPEAESGLRRLKLRNRSVLSNMRTLVDGLRAMGHRSSINLEDEEIFSRWEE